MTSTLPPEGLDPRLERLLGGAALGSLRSRMRRCFERRDNGAAGERLLLTQLAPHEHEALTLLAGRPWRFSRSVRIDLGQVDAALRAAGIAGSLREALERIDGPIENHAAMKEALQTQWSRVTGSHHRHAALRAWLQTPAAAALLKRLVRRDAEAAHPLLQRADAVLQRLPAHGLPLAQLAAETFGNAHALDSGQPTATVVLAAWRHAEGCRDAPLQGRNDNDDDPRVPEERTRDTWARAGVLVNELARPALCLNLPVQEPQDNGWMPGEPVHLSLRKLVRAAPAWAVADRAVFVCENPNLVAMAADRLGARCAPLVCTDGMPAAAQRTLLTQLADAGARLNYHGDFDWPGVRIANHVMRSWPTRPWRLGAGDYETAAMNAPHARPDLSGASVEATWDDRLAAVMRHHGLAIAEEAVAGPLFGDLQSA